jgi:hypothetical protein
MLVPRSGSSCIRSAACALTQEPKAEKEAPLPSRQHENAPALAFRTPSGLLARLLRQHKFARNSWGAANSRLRAITGAPLESLQSNPCISSVALRIRGPRRHSRRWSDATRSLLIEVSAMGYGPYANEELVCQALAAPTTTPHRRAVSEWGVVLSA